MLDRIYRIVRIIFLFYFWFPEETRNIQSAFGGGTALSSCVGACKPGVSVASILSQAIQVFFAGGDVISS
jgi:hypothetical protein